MLYSIVAAVPFGPLWVVGSYHREHYDEDPKREQVQENSHGMPPPLCRLTIAFCGRFWREKILNSDFQQGRQRSQIHGRDRVFSVDPARYSRIGNTKRCCNAALAQSQLFRSSF